MIWEKGKKYKLLTKEGSVFTAELIGIDGELIVFRDKYGVIRGISKSNIKEVRVLDDNR